MGSQDIAKLFGPQTDKLWGELGSPETVAQEQQMRQQTSQMIGQQMQMMGAPPDQIGQMVDEQLGPPQFVSMEDWLTEADRTIDSGSMRRMDIDAQMQNLNVAMNQLGPAVVNMPGGAEFIGALAAEFTKLNRFSPELQAAAANIITSIKMAQMMPPPGMPPQGPQQGPSQPKPPQSGPTGGAPTTEA
jgi:hypothetical protein